MTTNTHTIQPTKRSKPNPIAVFIAKHTPIVEAKGFTRIPAVYDILFVRTIPVAGAADALEGPYTLGEALDLIGYTTSPTPTKLTVLPQGSTAAAAGWERLKAGSYRYNGRTVTWLDSSGLWHSDSDSVTFTHLKDAKLHVEQLTA